MICVKSFKDSLGNNLSVRETKLRQNFLNEVSLVNSNFHTMVNSVEEEQIKDCYDVILECLNDILEYRLRIARQNK